MSDSPSTGLDWSRVRLLVVEDDDVVRHALEEMLKEADLGEYKFAAGGEEALDILADFRADIVLTEGNLQGMDSLDLLRRLRNKETSPNPGVLIVVMASMAETDRLRRMCGIGIESFIKKPISAKVVLKRLATVVAQPRRFVSSLQYFGPDRRTLKGAEAHHGPNRRREVAPKEGRKGAAVVLPEAAGEKPPSTVPTHSPSLRSPRRFSRLRWRPRSRPQTKVPQCRRRSPSLSRSPSMRLQTRCR